jgi:PAS domain S-box-containing protein
MSDDAGEGTRTVPRESDRERKLARYGGIADVIEEGIYRLDLDGRFVAVNDVVVERTGYSRDELLGEHVSLLLDEDDVERFESAVRDLLAAEGDGVRTLETEVREADGGRLPVEVRLGLDEEGGEARGTVGVVRDVSERRERERELAESRRKLSAAFDSLPGIVYRCRNDPDWSMEFVIGNGVDVAGHDTERLESGAVSWGGDVVHPDDRDEVRAGVREALSGDGSFDLTYRIRTADGETRWVRDEGRAIRSDGEVEVLEGYITDVTEEQLAERERREREQQFRSVVKNVEEYAIFRLDPDGTVASWNAGAERIKGYEEAEILGEHVSTFYTDEDVADGRPEEHLATAAERGHAEDEGWRVRSDGSRFWASVDITALYGDDGDLTGFAKITRDMTDQRDRENALRREHDLLEEVLDATPVDITVFTADGEIERANAIAKANRGLEEGDAGLVAEDRTLYDEDGEPIPPEEWPFATVRATGEPVRDRRVRLELGGGEDRWLSVNAAPITGENGEVERVISAAVDITERKEREQQLRRERDLLEQILGTSPAGIAVLDAEGSIVRANERAEELLGLTVSEIEGRTYDEPEWNIFHEGGEPITPDEHPVTHVLETGEPVFGFDHGITLPDGTERWLSSNSVPVFDEAGDIERVVVAIDDVTQLKEQAERLERQRDELRSELNEVFTRVSEAVFAVDRDWRFTYVNDRAEGLLDRSEGELLGRDLWDVFPEAVGTRFQDAYEEAMATQESVTFEEYYPPMATWFEVQAYPSESGLSVYFRDVTERKERERELERYETIVETVDDGIYVLDDEGRFTMVNGAYASMLGYDEDELLGEPASMVVSGEVRDRAAAAERRLKSGESDFESLEAPLETASGDEIVAEATFALLPAEGEARRVGVVRDVTERRERERELAESEQRYRTIAENFPNGSVVMFDDDLRYTLIAGELADELGVDTEAWVGEQIGDVHPPEVRDEFVEHYRAAIDGETSTFEVEYGDRILQVRAVPVRDDDGEVFAGMGMSQDVTERKHRERERQTIVDRATDAVVKVDADWRFTMVDDRAEEIYDMDEDALLGRDFWEVFSTALGTRFETEYRKAMETRETRTFEAHYPDLDGWFRVSVYPDDDGGLSFYFTDVTERKEREHELRQYKEYTDGVLNAVDDVFYILDENGDLARWNESLPEVTGYADAEIESMHALEFFGDDDDDRQRIADAIREGFETGGTRVQAEFLTAGGESIPFEFVATRLENPDGERVLAGIGRNIAERVERERELERYETVVETIWDGVYALDPDDNFVMVNEAFCELVGYEREELLGEHPTLVNSEEVNETATEIERRIIAGERDVGVIEYEFERADGETVPVETRFGPYQYDDERYGRTGVARDITERKRYEETLRGLHESANALIQAETAECVDELLVDAVTDVLDLSGTVVYRLDEDGEMLCPTARSVSTDFMRGEFPCVPPGEGSITGRVFESGEPKRYEDITKSSHLDADAVETDMRSGVFVPLGGHGILVVGSTDVGAFDDRTQQLVELVAASAEEAYGRVDRERRLRERESQLATRVRQQEAVSRLGRQALETDDLDELMGEASRVVADVLGNDYAKVLELRPEDEELLLRRGVGWHDGIVGQATVASNANSQAGYTLTSEGPVIVDDLESETRFSGPDLLTDHAVRSGISTVIGSADNPWGILGTHDTDVREFTENDANFVQAVANVLASAIDRHGHERELANRAHQQKVVTELGRRALEERDLDALMDSAADRVAETLDADYVKVLEYHPDEDDLRPRAGTGWVGDWMAEAVAGPDRGYQAGYTLRSADPVVVEDFEGEDRFVRSELLADHDVRSGISVAIGPHDDPWGVLSAHATDVRQFSENDVAFVQAVANVLMPAIERRARDQELERRREQLEALDDLNGVVRDITGAALQQSTREEIEQLVCDRLADTDSYLFSWIGAVDGTRKRVTLRTEAGVDGYLDDIEITYDDSETSRGATGRAIHTREMQVTHRTPDDPDYEPWREQVEKYGFRSSAAIPIVYEGSLYGVLNVYSERPDAFDGQEGDVIGQLGEVVGHAIAAVERKEALVSDDVIEIEFEIQNVFEAVGIDASKSGTITLDRTISAGGDDYIVYGTADEDGMATVRAVVEAVPHWESVEVLGEGDDVTRFEVRLTEPPVVTRVAAQNGRVQSARIENGDYRITVHLPHGADVRRLVDGVQETYAGAEVIAQRQTTQRERTSRGLNTAVLDELTERQRAALEAAYFAGFFEWPRESTGEEVAESLDIAAATFHQHMRAGERKLLTALFGEA